MKMWPSVTVSVSPCDVETPFPGTGSGRVRLVGGEGPGHFPVTLPVKLFNSKVTFTEAPPRPR